MTNPTLTSSTNVDSRLTERADRTLRVQAERTTHQLRELESEMVDLHHDGTIQEDRDSARQLIESVRADLVRARKAIDRIDAGTYGLCTGCKEPIAAARLRAIPEAERCTRCA